MGVYAVPVPGKRNLREKEGRKRAEKKRQAYKSKPYG